MIIVGPILWTALRLELLIDAPSQDHFNLITESYPELFKTHLLTWTERSNGKHKRAREGLSGQVYEVTCWNMHKYFFKYIKKAVGYKTQERRRRVSVADERICSP